MEAYLNKLVKLKPISESERAQAFFRQRPGDPKQDDPILQGALLELENGSESPWTRENTKLVINGTGVGSPQGLLKRTYLNSCLTFGYFVATSFFLSPMQMSLEDTA